MNTDLLHELEHDARRLVEGVTYQIRVTAINEVGLSDPSEPSSEFIPLGKSFYVRNSLTPGEI